MKTSAFSLIELMVVIAIVAVLAAVALPAYTNYLISSKISGLVPIIENLMNVSIQSSQQYGWFGNASSLGYAPSTPCAYPPTPANCTGATWLIDSSVAEQLSPYFGGLTETETNNQGTSYMLVGDFSNSGWGQYGSVLAALNPQLLGFPLSEVDLGLFDLYLECDYWHYEGSIDKLCYYGYGTATVSQTGDLVPGWVNVNTTNAWDNNNFTLYETDATSYINATGQ